MSTDEILAAVLALDARTRAKVAHRIIASLDEAVEGLGDAEWEAAWVEESERRLAGLRGGRVNGIDGDQVFARARARLNS